jgi:hypothetical protein
MTINYNCLLLLNSSKRNRNGGADLASAGGEKETRAEGAPQGGVGGERVGSAARQAKAHDIGSAIYPPQYVHPHLHTLVSSAIMIKAMLFRRTSGGNTSILLAQLCSNKQQLLH